MEIKIVKRDGRVVGFDRTRIVRAIGMAMRECNCYNRSVAESLAIEVENQMKHQCSWNVDSVQNLVERQLMSSGLSEVARVYIIYRNKRDKARGSKSNEIISDIISAKKNDITRENANMNADTPAGMMMKIASERSKEYVDDYLLSDDTRISVDENLLHIHDKDYYPSKSLTCVSSRTDITIKLQSGEIKHVKASYLDGFFDQSLSDAPQMVQPKRFVWVMGRNGWTKITGIARRALQSNDSFYHLQTYDGVGIEVTGSHFIPVIDKNTKTEIIKRVDDISIGDKLMVPVGFNADYTDVDYIDVLKLLIDSCEIYPTEVVATNIDRLRAWFEHQHKTTDLPKLVNTCDKKYGVSYIYLSDLKYIIDTFEVPYDVLNAINLRFTNDDHPLPVYFPVTTDLAKIVGYLHRCGSIYYNSDADNYQIVYSELGHKSVVDFEQTFSRVFSNNLNRGFVDGEERFVVLCGKMFYILFKHLLGSFSTTTVNIIPNFIMVGTREIKWNYLSCMLDNRAYMNGYWSPFVCIKARSITHAQDLVFLLKTISISARVRTEHNVNSSLLFEKSLKEIGLNISHNVVVDDAKQIKSLFDNLGKINFIQSNELYAEKPSKAVIYKTEIIKRKIELPTKGEVVYDLETAEHWWTANGYVVHNCLQHPINQILASGFKAGHGESRPAKRIETASILGCISMEQVQNEMHGGQAIPAFDFFLAPYVRKTYVEEIEKIEKLHGTSYSSLKEESVSDYLYSTIDANDHVGEIDRVRCHAINMTVERVHQAMEAFVHNMNTIHSRGGNQVVFSSVNYGTDTSAEGRCVIRELLHTTYNGVGNGATAIFPIQIWKKKRGVNYLPGDPNYDLYEFACKVTAKRFFPNFLNLDAPFNQSANWRSDDPERYRHEVATMGCRTRVFENRFDESTSVGRGNLSFSTINLPGLALSVMEILDQEKRIVVFFEKLRSMIDIAGKQLHDRYEFQCTALAKQFPLLMSGMWVGSENLSPESEVRPVLKHGTLGVGFIGLAECLVALIGKHHGESDEAQNLGLKIITFMRDEVKKLSEKYDLNYSVLATPAEGVSGKFTKKDQKKYGIVKGVTDKEYYTNSNHIPVHYHCSASHKAKVEAPYHDLTRGGHIFYVELDGDATHNVQAVKDIVSLMDKYNVGYSSVNHNRNRCLECGYEDASKDLESCPCCGGNNIDRLQRITGYLVGTTDRWNSAKLAELKDRTIHS